MLYPTHLKSAYDDDISYRIFIRDLFSMKHQSSWDPNYIHEVDDVSIDEYDYDEDAASQLLDSIYAETHSIPVFNELYVLAAATMMSEDTSIGLAVLFSYNFAYVFHNCIISYVINNDTEYSGFKELQYSLSKK
jgi:hypothetical protein